MNRPVSGNSSERSRLVSWAGVASVTAAVFLLAIKAWAWLATDSVALLGGLADSFLDLLASMMTLIAVRLAAEPADREHRFGHGKLEAVAGLLQASLIVMSSAYVAYNAIARLITPAPVSAPEIGIAVTLVSLGVTAVLVAYQRRVIRRTGSVAIRADSLHYAADLLGNLAVLVAIGLSAGLGWHAADPLLGLVIVFVILASVRDILSQALAVLLDRELSPEIRNRILEIATSHAEVRGVHDLRTRSASTKDFIQLHLELDPTTPLADAHRISDEVETNIRRQFSRAELIIHVDPAGISEPRDRF